MSEQYIPDLPTKLRVYRAENQLTQSEMAKKLGMTLRTYQYIEQGVRSPSLAVLMLIAYTIGLKIDENEIPKENIGEANHQSKIKSNNRKSRNLETIISDFRTEIKFGGYTNEELNEIMLMFIDIIENNKLMNDRLDAYVQRCSVLERETTQQ